MKKTDTQAKDLDKILPNLIIEAIIGRSDNKSCKFTCYFRNEKKRTTFDASSYSDS